MKTAVQCVEFARTHFTESEARAWLERHKYKFGNVKRFPQSLAYMQRAESLFDRASIVDIDHSPGIRLLVGRLRDFTPVQALATERLKCQSVPLGAQAASGRFLIFAQGPIRTDMGISIMTPEAGAEVIRRFRERGNDMPIDLRHFMIDPKANREQSEAMGWIHCPDGLQYVKGEGLWAVGVKWDPAVKAGLESDPPKWKYHSPYYDQDKKTKVITQLLNVALTNMPATHGLAKLAAERETGMDLAEKGKALLAAKALADSGDETAQLIYAALVYSMGDEAEAAINAATAQSAPMAEPEDEFMSGMSEEDKVVYAGMSEGMKATYQAGKKAMAAQAAPAEDDTPKEETAAAAPVAAESAPEGLAAGLDASHLLAIAKGEDAETATSRQRMVAEAKKSGLLTPKTEALLLDTSKVSDRVAAEFVAARKTTRVTIGGPVRTPITAQTPTTKNGAHRVSAELRAEAERMSKITKTPVDKLLAQLVDAEKGKVN